MLNYLTRQSAAESEATGQPDRSRVDAVAIDVALSDTVDDEEDELLELLSLDQISGGSDGRDVKVCWTFRLFG